MSHEPSELHYTSTHEWLRLEDDNKAVVGISHHAQRLLGDMVFVELPELATTLMEGDDAAVAESVKAASDVFTPVAGTVIGINDELEGAPEQINRDSYGAGWLFSIKLSDPDELDELMTAEEYQQLIDSESD